MTQWIFRADTCHCDVPTNQMESSQLKELPAFDLELDDGSESEVEIDSQKFPVERFKALRILGEGAFGRVYLALDRLLGKRVAVKILKHPEAKAVMSFQNEARLACQLNHPNIIKVIDVAITTGGAPYMVMELAHGVSLEERLKHEGPLSIDRCTEIFSQILSALGYAHESGILHRDIKPSNIIINSQDGSEHVKLIDFGTAKLQEFLSQTLSVGGSVLIGTPAYMSPDMANGLRTDNRSDLYSVGCVLFESLTGAKPFTASSPLDTMYLHANQPPPSLSDYYERSPIIEELDRVIQRSLAKDPALRYQRASHFQVAINATLTHTGSFKSNSPLRLKKPALLTISLVAAAGVVSVFASTLPTIVKDLLSRPQTSAKSAPTSLETQAKKPNSQTFGIPTQTTKSNPQTFNIPQKTPKRDYLRLDTGAVTSWSQHGSESAAIYEKVPIIPSHSTRESKQVYSRRGDSITFSFADLTAYDISSLLPPSTARNRYHLMFSDCNLDTDNIRAIAEANRFAQLNFTRCAGITKDNFALLFSLNQLHGLTISECTENGAFDNLASFQDLSSLRMSQKLTDRIASQIESLKKLRDLSLSRCQISEDAANHIARTQITSLVLSACSLHKNSMQKLSSANRLKSLSLPDEPLTAEICRSITNFRALRTLQVCWLKDAECPILALCPLEEIAISDSPQLSTSGLKELVKLGNSKIIKLRNSNLPPEEVAKFNKENPRCQLLLQ